ncbi:MAG TPA: kelch repeat-containing protein, partial [Gemmataceae bacterium]|nr:kelch repeat-containing protein [Gemmataceae bacterium]
NSDLVVRVIIDANGIPTVNNPLVAGPSTLVRVDLQGVTATQIAGKARRGIVINSTGTRAYVFSFVSRSITEIDISNPTSPSIISTDRASALPTPGTTDATALLGAELFFTGRGPQGRMSSESWGGCIVCHPNGRADGITWMFDAGPRQTIPLDGMFNRDNPNDQRVLNWSAVRDENHDFELNTRGVFGGRGLIDDDRLFLAIAGTSGAVPTDSGLIEQFQQFTGAVSKTNDLLNGAALPTLTAPRRDFAIATLDDGRVFIIGGRTRAGQGDVLSGTVAILEFNPRTNVLRSRSSLGFTPRHSLGAAAVRTSQGFRIYAVGGYTSGAGTTAPSNLVQEYNPATDTWRNVASLPTAVAQFGITAAGGINTAEPIQLIHAVSGNTGSENTPSVANPNPVQRFQADPAGPGTWSAFTVPGLTLRRNHGAAVALRGVQSRIFVIGGQDAGGTVLDTVEEYLAQAVVIVATPHTNLPAPAPRARFGIGGTLTTNQIYVIGGIDGTGADQTTVFEYTTNNNGPTPGPPGTPSGGWVIRANLSVPRRGLQVSTPPSVTNFLPFRSAGRDARQDAIAVWIQRNVRSARAPVPASDTAAQAGRTLFGQVGLVVPGFSCATCHGGPRWTRSTVDYTAPPSPEVGLGLGNERVIGAELRQTKTQNPAFPSAGTFPGVLINVGTFTTTGRTNEIRANAADPGQAIAPLGANGFNIPSLLSVHETAPYFYSGLATTLAQVLDGSQDNNGGVRHHFVTDATQRAQLIQFLRSIDQTTPTFP